MLSSRIRLISLNSQSFFISNFFLLGTGETAKNMKYLLDIGVTHLLNTAENDCNMNPKKYGKEGICYKGFRCPDLPQADISQFFDECVEFIDRALSFSCGKVFVSCLLVSKQSSEQSELQGGNKILRQGHPTKESEKGTVHSGRRATFSPIFLDSGMKDLLQRHF